MAAGGGRTGHPAGWSHGAAQVSSSSAMPPPLSSGVAVLFENLTGAEIPSVRCRTMQWMRKSSYAKISLAMCLLTFSGICWLICLAALTEI